jgi:hypothetical protein
LHVTSNKLITIVLFYLALAHNVIVFCPLNLVVFGEEQVSCTDEQHNLNDETVTKMSINIKE